MRHVALIYISALLFVPIANAEAANGIATATLNLRAGPGTQYRYLGHILDGANLTVVGCTSGYGWCRVNYAGLDGWVSSRYIAVQSDDGFTGPQNFGSAAANLGIPLIAGIVIGSAITSHSNRAPYPWHPAPYPWQPEPYWTPGRPHWMDRPGWHNHPGYHPNFYGPGDRWKPYRLR